MLLILEWLDQEGGSHGASLTELLALDDFPREVVAESLEMLTSHGLIKLTGINGAKLQFCITPAGRELLAKYSPEDLRCNGLRGDGQYSRR